MAQTNRATFPAGFDQMVMYGDYRRGSGGELAYALQETIDIAKEGQQLPPGTVLVLEIYNDGALTDYFVMEKGEGWGLDFTDEDRTGDWISNSSIPQERQTDRHRRSLPILPSRGRGGRFHVHMGSHAGLSAMKLPFSLRLFLDLVAVSLLLVALAYDWLGNTAHEIIGTAMFALLVSHNIFNRRWYGTITKSSCDTEHRHKDSEPLAAGHDGDPVGDKRVDLAGRVRLSPSDRHIYSAPSSYCGRLSGVDHRGDPCRSALDDDHGFRARQAGHHFRKPWHALAMRGLAAVIAAYGVHSLFAVNVGSKLLLQTTIEFWDFEAATPAFLFILWASWTCACPDIRESMIGFLRAGMDGRL